MILSENEYLVIQLMWKEKKPLTRAEILKGIPEKNWNPASIHLILNSMISKGAIKITDEEKKYGRTYEPIMSFGKYIEEVLQTCFPNTSMYEIAAYLKTEYLEE